MKPPTPAKLRLPKKQPEPVAPFPEHGHVCLNCGHEVSNNFCSICGQSTATHRLSIKHFVLHDLVHSIWHVDRGIFFTLKEVLIRPGYAALEYIRGKRAGRFPILTLLLLLTGLFLWLSSIGKPEGVHPATRVDGVGTGAEFTRQIFAFINHNKKWLLLGLIPVGSLSTVIVFRRTRLNYTEQLLVNCYVFAGLLVLLVIIRLLVLALPSAAHIITSFELQIVLLFYFVGYWQAYHRAYRLRGLIWHYCLSLMLTVFFLVMVVVLILGTTLLTHPELMRPNS